MNSFSPHVASGDPGSLAAARASSTVRFCCGEVWTSSSGSTGGRPVEVRHRAPLRRHRLVVERDQLFAASVVVPEKDPLGVVGDQLDGRVHRLSARKLRGCRAGHTRFPPASRSPRSRTLWQKARPGLRDRHRALPAARCRISPRPGANMEQGSESAHPARSRRPGATFGPGNTCAALPQLSPQRSCHNVALASTIDRTGGAWES